MCWTYLLDLPVLLSHCVAFMTDLNVGQTISNINSLVLLLVAAPGSGSGSG